MELITKQGYKQTEVGLIPEDWNFVKIQTLMDDNIIVSHLDGNHGALYPRSSEFTDNGVPYITAKDFINGYVDFNNVRYLPIDRAEQFQKGIAKDGDVLFAHNATVGPTAVIRTNLEYVILSTTATYFRTDNSKLNNYYLRYFFESNFFVNQYGAVMRQSTRNQIPITQQRKFSVIIPPTLTEQKAIATALSDVDALIASLEQTITKKKAIKQGAMQALLNGKIRLNGFGETKTMKESEFGLIPEDWDVKLLPEVFDYIHGKAHEQHIDSTGIFTVVNSKFISTEGKVTKYSKENFCSARKGDILTVLSDLPNGKALAKTYFVNTDNKYAVNQRICIWRSKKDSPLFLSFVMNRHKYFMKFDDGVTQTHILNHHIEKCPVLVPRDLNEQNAIGQILSDMDTEITQLESKKEKYQAIKQGMMQELLKGKTRLV